MTRNVEKDLSLGARKSKREFVPVHSMKAYGDRGMGPYILVTCQKKNVARMVLKMCTETGWVGADWIQKTQVRLTDAFCEHGNESSGSKNRFVLVFI
jgi:hypothetical protein